MTMLEERTLLADPCDYLNDDCMKHVLSFVGGKCETRYWNKTSSSRYRKQRERLGKMKEVELPGPGPYWKLQDAANLCFVLASVSRAWKRIVDKSGSDVISLPLDVNLDEFSSERAVQRWLSWLCRHKPCVGKFRSHKHWPGLTKQLVEVFEVCDTSQLNLMQLPLSLCQPLQAETTMMEQQQQQLQTVIAHQCPNLQELSIFVAAKRNPSSMNMMSCSKFLSLPSLLGCIQSIRKVEIWLIVANKDNHITGEDGLTLNALVKHVPDIHQLDESTLDLLSRRKPTELLFEPIMGAAEECQHEQPQRKCALGLVTADSFYHSLR